MEFLIERYDTEHFLCRVSFGDIVTRYQLNVCNRSEEECIKICKDFFVRDHLAAYREEALKRILDDE